MLLWSVISLVVLTTNCLAGDTRPRQTERSVRITKPDTNKPVVFPTDDDVPPISTRTTTASQPNEPIPESVLIRMSNLQTAEDFLNFLSPPPIHAYESNPEERVPINGSGVIGTSVGILNRKGLSGTLNKELAQAAGCQVEMKAVELERPSDPSILMWPSCTRLPRCGGCCSSSLLECVPTKTSKMEISVIQARYKGKSSGNFDVLGTVKVKVEKHEKCQCQCAQRAEHCTELQTYRKDECKCVCINVSLKKACTGNDHVWDHKDCQCKCKAVAECSTGFFYSMETCKCEVFRLSRIGSRRLPGNDRSVTVTSPTTTKTTTTTTQPPQAGLGGDFGAPLAHLSGGERSKFASETHVNIKPYDAEPFTLAQTGRARKGRPVLRVDSGSTDKSVGQKPRV